MKTKEFFEQFEALLVDWDDNPAPDEFDPCFIQWRLDKLVELVELFKKGNENEQD